MCGKIFPANKICWVVFRYKSFKNVLNTFYLCVCKTLMKLFIILIKNTKHSYKKKYMLALGT